MLRLRILIAASASIVALGAALAWHGPQFAERWRVERQLAATPSLDPELAVHLLRDPDDAWLTYARSLGPRPLMDAVNAMSRELARWPYARFERDRGPYERRLVRVTEALWRDFGCERPFAFWSENARLPAREDQRRFDVNRAYVVTIGERSLEPAARLARLDSLSECSRALHNPDQVMALELAAAQIELERGRPDRHRARCAAALAIARDLRDDYFVCQVLGELGVAMHQAGHPDSMQSCFDEALAIAGRHQFPDQTSRILTFAARVAAEDGHLATAADRLAEARERCESYGGGSARVRLAIENARFLSDLGCWELAQRSLDRLPPLLREFPSRSEFEQFAKYRFEADRLRARAAFAHGRIDEATGTLEPWLAAMPAWNRRIGLATIDREWAWGLQHNGRDAEALLFCDRGLAHCDSAHVPEVALGLALCRARLLESAGRWSEVAAAIRDADSRAHAAADRESATARRLAVLRARALFHEGRRAAGLDTLRRAFASLAREARARDADDAFESIDAEGLSLRDAVHDGARLSPEAGFGFELRWRSAGRRGVALAGDPFAPSRPSDGSIHIVYHFMGRTLWRWTATARGVSLDTLALSPDSCLADVRSAVALLRTEHPLPGQWYGARAVDVLRRLSHVLLGDSVVRSLAGARRIEVSPDGPLAELPFEALPIRDARGEAPLAALADVAYSAGYGPSGGAPAEHALVVSNPELPASLQHRYAWAGALAGTVGEARAALARWPGATDLHGRDATRDALLAAAPHATTIYIAAHHVRDPGAPPLAFVPLASMPPDTSQPSLFESADLRALDLRRCRLAVLASCASGAPSRAALQPGPSLGDAFLDAGARRVVQSFWNVGDDETRAFMEHFLEAQRDAHDDVAALGRARRDAMAGGAGVPPRVWAAWSIAETEPGRAARAIVTGAQIARAAPAR